MNGLRDAARTAGLTITHVWGHPAVRGERVRAVGRYLGWQGWQRAVGRPLTVGMVGGLRLRCYPHSTAAAGVLYTRLPEWESMRFLLDHLRPGDVFVDVGANVGTYTLLGASVEGVSVVAFEPSARSFERLAENVRLNRLTQVDARRLAVGDADGTVELTVGLDTVNRIVPDQAAPPRSVTAGSVTSGSATTGLAPPGSSTSAARSERVPLGRLDTVLAGVSNIGLIKIDVEGHEPAVLLGAAEVLRRHGPALIVECNDAERLATILRDFGYTPCQYDPAQRLLRELDLSRENPTNVLAVRDMAAAQERLRAPQLAV